MRFHVPLITLAVTAAILPAIAGCGDPVTTNAAIAGGVVGVTLVGAQSPGQEIEQTYYLGVFDPQDQLPPEVYRVTVHGQASAISGMKFGSGWVPAQFVDSLGTRASFSHDTDDIALTAGEEKQLATLKTGRRLLMFGPEGFREAPKDHRLVIIMGASPEKFFQAIDTSLGMISQVQKAKASPQLMQLLLQERDRLRADQQRLDVLDAAVKVELPDSSANSTSTK